MGVHGNILRTRDKQLIKVKPDQASTDVQLSFVGENGSWYDVTLSLEDVYDLKALFTQHREKFYQFSQGYDRSRFLLLIGHIYGAIFGAQPGAMPPTWDLIAENVAHLNVSEEELLAALDVISDAADFVPLIKKTR